MTSAMHNEPIRTDGSNWFAHHTMHQRVPGIMADTLAHNPDYPTAIKDGLRRLGDSIAANAPIPALKLPAPDHDAWRDLYAPQAGDTWLNTQWFFAEYYFYRQVIEITRWWETGRDPFGPKKEEEVSGTGLWGMLDQALTIQGDVETRLAGLLHSATWGNRVDLSYNTAAAHGRTGHVDDLIDDDTEQVVSHLMARPGDVHIIADNAGAELALDLVLIDFLLTLRPGNQLVMHVKTQPVFVSDTIVADVHHFLRRLVTPERDNLVRGLGERLQNALERGQLRLAPDLFWSRSNFLRDLPPRLTNTFGDPGVALVILKGDANYRRAMDDTVWPYTMPFREAVNYFPAPLLALRTLKSDPVVGLAEGMAAQLDTEDATWRFNGRRAVIQFSGITDGAIAFHSDDHEL